MTNQGIGRQTNIMGRPRAAPGQRWPATSPAGGGGGGGDGGDGGGGGDGGDGGYDEESGKGEEDYGGCRGDDGVDAVSGIILDDDDAWAAGGLQGQVSSGSFLFTIIVSMVERMMRNQNVAGDFIMAKILDNVNDEGWWRRLRILLPVLGYLAWQRFRRSWTRAAGSRTRSLRTSLETGLYPLSQPY